MLKCTHCCKNVFFTIPILGNLGVHSEQLLYYDMEVREKNHVMNTVSMAKQIIFRVFRNFYHNDLFATIAK